MPHLFWRPWHVEPPWHDIPVETVRISPDCRSSDKDHYYIQQIKHDDDVMIIIIQAVNVAHTLQTLTHPMMMMER